MAETKTIVKDSSPPHGAAEGFAGDFGPNRAAVGAARIGQGKGFFCQGKGGRIVKVVAVPHGLMAAEGGNPAFANVFTGAAQGKDFLYRFGIAQAPAFGERVNAPTVFVFFDNNGELCQFFFFRRKEIIFISRFGVEDQGNQQFLPGDGGSKEAVV
jgi:hypothetical protein